MFENVADTERKMFLEDYTLWIRDRKTTARSSATHSQTSRRVLPIGQVVYTGYRFRLNSCLKHVSLFFIFSNTSAATSTVTRDKPKIIAAQVEISWIWVQSRNLNSRKHRAAVEYDKCFTNSNFITCTRLGVIYKALVFFLQFDERERERVYENFYNDGRSTYCQMIMMMMMMKLIQI